MPSSPASPGGPLMSERQSMIWLQQLLPQRFPRSVSVSVPYMTRGIKEASNELRSLTSGESKPEKWDSRRMKHKLRFEVTSQLALMQPVLGKAALCPCHRMPVEHPVAPARAAAPSGLGPIVSCCVSHERLDPTALVMDRDTFRVGGGSQALRVHRAALEQQEKMRLERKRKMAATQAAISTLASGAAGADLEGEPFSVTASLLSADGSNLDALVQSDELVLEKVIRVSH